MTSPNDQPQSDDSTAQPEYGQVAKPEYGAMTSQYPAGYDPYVYGRPESEDARANVNDAAPDPQPSTPVRGTWRQPGYGRQPHADGRQAAGDGRPQPFNGIDMDDPRQNPLYGHWDFYAIIALVFALLMPVPVLPAIIGGVAMWRTRNFRMRGHGLALAAVIINVIYTLGVLWMMLNGLSALDLYQQLLDGLTGREGGDGSTSIHA